MDGINIGYFRVSKEDETLQDLDSQIEAVQQLFNVKFDKIYKERGSAYDLNKIHKRTEFIRLLKDLFKDSTIKDVFIAHNKTSKINLYVWDYDRIMRNIALNTLFLSLCDLFDVTIYSYKDGKTNKKENETPSETFARYMMSSIHAFTGQQYSYTISTNIKKVVEHKKNISARSKDGKKWGRPFTGLNGENILLTERQESLLNKRILKLVKGYEKMKFKGYYSSIQDEILRKQGIRISKQYISNVRNKNDE